MSNEYLKIGQQVNFGPAPETPAATEENPNPVAPAHPTGVVRGVMHLEDPVSYLVVKDADGSNEWFPADQVKAVDTKATEAAGESTEGAEGEQAAA